MTLQCVLKRIVRIVTDYFESPLPAKIAHTLLTWNARCQVIESAPPHTSSGVDNLIVQRGHAGKSSGDLPTQSPLVVRSSMKPRGEVIEVGKAGEGEEIWRRQAKKQLMALGRRLWVRSTDVSRCIHVLFHKSHL